MKQRATMKPIPAWLLVSKKTGEPKSASGDVALALIYFDEKVARKSRYSSERVVAVEIRERPKPRRHREQRQVDQAIRFGVTQATISNVLTRRTYRQVE